MNFENFITSYTGLIHFSASILSLILGTFVLVFAKGTTQHKIIGRFYSFTMLTVLISAFMMYRLFGTWGIFHWAAVISSLTLICGLIPILRKKPVNNYMYINFTFMYWSVIGVYGAFVSETLVRMPKVIIESGIPNHVFYNLTGIGTALVMSVGMYFYFKLKPKWDKQFGQKLMTTIDKTKTTTNR
jgi:uncharacterized membrane protein